MYAKPKTQILNGLFDLCFLDTIKEAKLRLKNEERKEIDDTLRSENSGINVTKTKSGKVYSGTPKLEQKNKDPKGQLNSE